MTALIKTALAARPPRSLPSARTLPRPSHIAAVPGGATTPPPQTGFHYRKLGTGHSFDLGAEGAGEATIISLHERGSVAHVPAGWTSVWVMLKGHSLLATPYVEIALRGRDSVIWSDGNLRATALKDAWLLGLAAPTGLWKAFPVSPGTSRRQPVFSRVARADRDVVKLLIRMVRERESEPLIRTSLFRALCAAVRDSQQDLETWLSRCSGHTLSSKEQTLHRLMRARNVLVHSNGVQGSIPDLARLARYSPTHFKRLYREVFGVSAGEHAYQLKVEHTWHLVTSTSLALVDVCEAVGFESKSALCRTFKQRFGITTTQAREGAEPALAV